MDEGERGARAARNEGLFRALNEQLTDLNEALSEITQRFAIACECADTSCIEMLDISVADYSAARANPRRFIVLPWHVYPDIERVVSESDGYVVVEKIGVAGEVAEQIEPDQD